MSLFFLSSAIPLSKVKSWESVTSDGDKQRMFYIISCQTSKWDHFEKKCICIYLFILNFFFYSVPFFCLKDDPSMEIPFLLANQVGQMKINVEPHSSK